MWDVWSYGGFNEYVKVCLDTMENLLDFFFYYICERTGIQQYKAFTVRSFVPNIFQLVNCREMAEIWPKRRKTSINSSAAR